MLAPVVSDRARRWSSYQPNVPGRGILAGYTWRFWLLIVFLGVATGLLASALMGILRLTQHLAYGFTRPFICRRRDRDHRPSPVRDPPARRVDRRGRGAPLPPSAHHRGDGGLRSAVAAPRTTRARAQPGPRGALGRHGRTRLLARARGRAAARRCLAGQPPVGLGRATRSGSAGSWLPPGPGRASPPSTTCPWAARCSRSRSCWERWRSPLVLPALAVSVIATAVAWIFLGTAHTYAMPTFGLQAAQMVWALVCGPLIGLAAVVWVRLIQRVNRVRLRGRGRTARAPLLVFGALGLLSIRYPELLGNGKGIVAGVAVRPSLAGPVRRPSGPQAAGHGRRVLARAPRGGCSRRP